MIKATEMGVSKSVVRYLGNYCSYNQSKKAIVEVRIFNAKEAYDTLGKL